MHGPWVNIFHTSNVSFLFPCFSWGNKLEKPKWVCSHLNSLAIAKLTLSWLSNRLILLLLLELSIGFNMHVMSEFCHFGIFRKQVVLVSVYYSQCTILFSSQCMPILATCDIDSNLLPVRELMASACMDAPFLCHNYCIGIIIYICQELLLRKMELSPTNLCTVNFVITGCQIGFWTIVIV